MGRAEELLVDLFVEGFGEACREGEEGFSGAGGADERDEFDRIVHQEIEGHGLLEISRHDAEDRAAAAAHGDEGAVGSKASDGGVVWVLLVFQENEFVGVGIFQIEAELFF